ncbi:hypothetical protein EV214_12324 [Marinisporobacter balticus]|uniref:Uncharacterized protein n=1 Tax=Marinisporobacter balticus TaxID=2018667 RepID=A0A4R2KK88_9FIRM|nr:hypothetical protein EV214_12324 [Marinisporobacter balticus]
MNYNMGGSTRAFIIKWGYLYYHAINKELDL